MSSSVIIFLFDRLANVMEFMTGYFFMKCMDCTMKRRNGKFAFFLSLLLYTIVSTLVVFPKDMTNISPECFQRIHNRYLVNMNCISKIESASCICNGEELPVSRAYKQSLAVAFAKTMLN